MIVMCLCALCGVQAQTIRNGSKWWDGSELYTASVDKDGDVVMEGVNLHEGGFKFQLTKAEAPGMYYLTGDSPDAVLPVRGIIGNKVEYVRKEGMNFLAIRNRNNEAIYTLVLTPDNLENSVKQEESAEDQPVSDMLCSWLMNTYYLRQFSKDDLRLMRNEILARHGWKFQSKDLQEHFAKKAWYRPGDDNSQIKLSIIEQTNVQMIKNEELIPDEKRGYIDYSSGPVYNEDLRTLVNEGQFPGGLDDDGRGPDEVDGVANYVVNNEREFFAALGSNRMVTIAANKHLNLSRVLEDEEEFQGIRGRRWASIANDFIGKEPLIVSESETDGRQLALVNFKNLTIKGEQNASIEVDPRYSYCIYFINCENCEIHNLTIGHTEGGYCSGGVIGVKGGRMFLVKDCDLYGCGTYGLDLFDTSDFSLMNSNIHDCTYGIMELRNATAVTFNHCDFFNNREYTLIDSWDSPGLTFNDCRFFANWGDAPLFHIEQTFYLNNCKIYHPTQNLGTIDNASQQNCQFFENPLDNSIQGRGLGPQ